MNNIEYINSILDKYDLCIEPDDINLNEICGILLDKSLHMPDLHMINPNILIFYGIHYEEKINSYIESTNCKIFSGYSKLNADYMDRRIYDWSNYGINKSNDMTLQEYISMAIEIYNLVVTHKNFFGFYRLCQLHTYCAASECVYLKIMAIKCNDIKLIYDMSKIYYECNRNDIAILYDTFIIFYYIIQNHDDLYFDFVVNKCIRDKSNNLIGNNEIENKIVEYCDGQIDNGNIDFVFKLGCIYHMQNYYDLALSYYSYYDKYMNYKHKDVIKRINRITHTCQVKWMPYLNRYIKINNKDIIFALCIIYKNRRKYLDVNMNKYLLKNVFSLVLNDLLNDQMFSKLSDILFPLDEDKMKVIKETYYDI